MRDLVVEKASPFAFLVIVMWYLDGPRHMLSSVLYDVCMNVSDSFAFLGGFFR